MNIKQLLKDMMERRATDLHLTVGAPPVIRVDGDLLRMEYDPLTPQDTQDLVYSLLRDEQKKRFEMDKELDFAFGIKGLSRFRANVFNQRGCVACAIRVIPYEILGFEELGLPPVVATLAEKRQGLVLVTGPTGCGKSTTLASMLRKVNATRPCHIVTVEDPIEYVHHHDKGIVNQREIGDDTKGFASALRYILRQDPDVVLIGEMRDMETMQVALNIAETGHLTLATLHTNSTYESINRIIDTFPPQSQEQVRSQLSFVMLGVLTQQLVPRMRGTGRSLAAEVLVCTAAVRAAIREDKLHQIYGMMQAGQKFGMQTMNQALYKLYAKRDISKEVALERSPDPVELEQMMVTGREVL
ncbi:MAG TPA: type IV pilus twitching motility protein PilT [Candidatus Fermentibacter daniensis]|jgi:twitching motility protein PilT|nr:MAG: twitching motility protein pilT [Candidatus Fermentibacter daniensis]MBP7719837.1 type IV pilus twitching motility protein PilT [Candidatus Fermentibacter sp.]OQC70125.1 MAG: Twitching mobility protein [candidate division Hyd24-12 bacterium ADurb.Bin004]KZD16278.1 MAG: twitching motility protein pilT [Candidatus Fermentibacter daniensis]KZD17747.1 MAG: twitching motility protein pilT [Candidatus Fermentibacter daniensis]